MNKNIIIPYNFVPLVGDIDSQDVTHKKGTYTGVIEYSILTKTPLFIPNTSIDKSEKGKNAKQGNKHKTYDFFSYTDFSELKENDEMPTGKNMPVIPGSEVRGMFRSYFEILTNSCMSALDGEDILDKETSIDFKPGLIKKNENNTYSLYKYEPEERKLTVFKPVEVGQRKIYKINGKSISGYVTNVEETKKDGQQKQYSVCLLKEPDQTELVKAEVKKDIPINGLKKAIDSFRKKNIQKDYVNDFEYFIKPESSMECFLVSYGITNDKQYILNSVFARGPRKVNDMIRSFNTCSDNSKLCPACSLFGIIKEGNDGFSVPSRIRFTDLKCRETSAKDCYNDEITVPALGNPHVEMSNCYLRRPTKDAVYWNSDYYIDKEGNLYPNGCYINGRKFFWHNMIVNTEGEKPSKLNETIRPVKRGIIFDGKLYFDKITQTELNQLIYLLNCGEYKTKIDGKKHGYKLGKDKPYGYGSIAVAVDKVMIREFKQMDDRVERTVNEYKNDEYTNPEFDKKIQSRFNKITSFNILGKYLQSGYSVSYPNFGNNNDQDEYTEYIEPMRPEFMYIKDL